MHPRDYESSFRRVDGVYHGLDIDDNMLSSMIDDLEVVVPPSLRVDVNEGVEEMEEDGWDQDTTLMREVGKGESIKN